MAEGTRSLVPNPAGGQMPAEDIGFKAKSEDWNVYAADDGTILRMKLVAQKVSRALDGDEVFHKADGEPLYYIRYNVIISAEVPKALLKTPQ